MGLQCCFQSLVGGSEVWGSPSRAREGSAEASSLPSVSVPACVLRVPLPTSSSGDQGPILSSVSLPTFSPCQLPGLGAPGSASR